MSKKNSRRAFIKQTAAVSAGYWIGTQAISKVQGSALQSLAAACVGVGGKGSSDTSHISEMGVRIVGLCDVDKRTLTKKGREFKDAGQFQDFREMYSALGDKFDIVTVSTPDHTHATAAIRAMKMKKHVYCQKPLTWSIAEARKMREVAAEMGVVTQMGNQGTSEDGLREAVEVIRSGAIGTVKEVHVWTNRPIWPQGTGRPKGEDPVPAELNWDAWIGPAAMRPYKDGRVYHDFNWRGWLDFGTGALGDMACHTTNMPVMALDLWDPIAVTAVKNSGLVENETFPSNSTLMFEFPARNGLVATNFYWYDGGNLPDDKLLKQLPKDFQDKVAKQRAGEGKTSGALVVGSDGLLFSENDYGARYQLLPEAKYASYKLPAQSLPRIPFKGGTDERQKWEFVNSITGDYKPGTMSNFGYAGRLTETMLVGILALRAKEGQRLEWDAKNLKCTNVPDLNKFTSRTYRAGWEY